MAVIKVFDSKGVKTVELMGNVSEQLYDTPQDIEEDIDLDNVDNDFEEQ